MCRILTVIVLFLMMSCSEENSGDPSVAKEDQAVLKASARCGSSAMPWLRDMIRRAEKEFNYKGDIYAIQYTGGVAFLYQRWISSCFGCATYDCNGDPLVLSGSVMDEIIRGATEDNVIYTSF